MYMTRDAKKNFIEKAREKFDKKFEYSKFEYTNAKTKSIIICQVHGDFLQSPDKHLNSKYGCPSCARDMKSKGLVPTCKREPISKEEFLGRLGNTNYEIDLTNFGGLTVGFVLIICEKHGESRSTGQNLLAKKFICTGCASESGALSKTKTFEDFVNKAQRVHRDFYEYPTQEYSNRKTVVTIVCPYHGEFKKKAQKHLAGQGCFECRIEKLVAEGRLPGGYSLDLFLENPQIGKKAAWVYYFKVGDLYKVGITSTSVSDRAKAIKSLSKKPVKVIKTLSCSLEDAYAIEQIILKTFDDYRTYRRWSTELFSSDVLREKNLEDFSQLTHTSTSRETPSDSQ